MDVTYNPKQSARNVQERGLSFERALDFEFATATFILDDRRDYGEERWVAFGNLDGRLHVLCFVNKPDSIRVISFRKANEREGRKYDNPHATD